MYKLEEPSNQSNGEKLIFLILRSSRHAAAGLVFFFTTNSLLLFHFPHTLQILLGFLLLLLCLLFQLVLILVDSPSPLLFLGSNDLRLGNIVSDFGSEGVLHDDDVAVSFFDAVLGVGAQEKALNGSHTTTTHDKEIHFVLANVTANNITDVTTTKSQLQRGCNLFEKLTK